MERVVRERFPNRSEWSDLLDLIIQHATFEEYARFTGDDGASDVELLFWVIQEASSPNPVQASRWSYFRAPDPPHLSIARPRVDALSRIPSDALLPGVRPPRQQ
ncbi:hypothetical protein VPH35_040438 [Triticum aestivum]